MTGSLFLLLPIGLAFVALIGGMFWWAIFSGQFDDTQKGGESILMDDDSPGTSESPPGDERS
ncbi:MAG: cbb3-type cytochrome oxidase assembly protein CcoS [Alcaligenaceae bacterium]|nr:cbb3-type cytochrome oxidase assembly protein CcoS [Alcaligenaceae bacterium]